MSAGLAQGEPAWCSGRVFYTLLRHKPHPLVESSAIPSTRSWGAGRRRSHTLGVTTAPNPRSYHAGDGGWTLDWTEAGRGTTASASPGRRSRAARPPAPARGGWSAGRTAWCPILSLAPPPSEEPMPVPLWTKNLVRDNRRFSRRGDSVGTGLLRWCADPSNRLGPAHRLLGPDVERI